MRVHVADSVTCDTENVTLLVSRIFIEQSIKCDYMHTSLNYMYNNTEAIRQFSNMKINLLCYLLIISCSVWMQAVLRCVRAYTVANMQYISHVANYCIVVHYSIVQLISMQLTHMFIQLLRYVVIQQCS